MKTTIYSLIILVLLCVPAASGEAQGGGLDKLGADTVWSGEVSVESTLTVPKEVTLKVEPGTVVRFAGGAGLVVEGVLAAEGKPGSRITFTSADQEAEPGAWPGITFSGASEGSCLKDCVVERAGAVTVMYCSPEISGCELTGGVTGIVLNQQAMPEISGNRIWGMSDGGINCNLGAAPIIRDNVFHDCVNYGVAVNQNSPPEVSGNTFTGCGLGVTAIRTNFVLKGNTFEGNEAGILITSCGNATEVAGNKVIGNAEGIVCQQFATPLVERNLVAENDEGIVCFMSSSPMIRHNEITRNASGISCRQICNPIVMANKIYGNGLGIYLHLSSFARINGNDIYDNTMQIRLDNMSSDWENRVKGKPMRGAQAQNVSKANMGRAVRRKIDEDASFRGFVDATGNWWGPAVTAEMEDKGPDADIEGFFDYYDEPVRVYEGFEGEYVQDSIKYEGWLTGPAEGAGR